MDLVMHPVAQGPVDQLMLGDPGQVAEFGTDNDCAEVLAVITFDLEVIAGQ